MTVRVYHAKRIQPAEFREYALRASQLVKSLSNEHRLLILCLLIDGEKSVSELQSRIGLSQPTSSSHLARLRLRQSRPDPT